MAGPKKESPVLEQMSTQAPPATGSYPPPRHATTNASPGFALPRVSAGLREVLLRASLIGKEREIKDGLDITFTAILLGFLTSGTPLSRWFQEYVKSADIDVEEMLARTTLDEEALSRLAGQSISGGSVSNLVPTTSALNILQAAVALMNQFAGASPQTVELHQRHVMAAYIYRCPPDHERQLSSWRFDRIDWSNAFLSLISSAPELRKSELSQWVGIHKRTFGQEPQIPPSVETAPPAPSDVTPMHLDSPADVDYLGRKGFAEALVVRLNRVWRESSRKRGRSSFVLHMHGPWGSGKTSLLNFLRRELQPPPPHAPDVLADEASPLPWIVVEFNAWQHQRINPPWWPLLDAIYTQSVGQLARKKVFDSKLHAWRVRFMERLWRLCTLRRDYLVAMVVGTVAMAGLIFWLWHSGGQWDVATLGKSIGTTVGTVSVVWSAFLVAGRTFVSGSARSAQTFMETAGDPMERICRHFGRLAVWINKPIVIFIDDLDRCQPKYVVDLLEGIQTLFSNPRVVYVIAADRRWLNTCFETSYQTFADAVKEPGRRLGSLFLEKAFELSVSVPRMSREMRGAYLDYLLRGEHANIEQLIEKESSRMRDEFAGAETEEQVLERLNRGENEEAGDEVEKALRQQVRTSAAVRMLASRKVAASTEYFLMPFAPLLEPNPRAMKRLVNAYAVLRDMTLLAGVNILGDGAQRKQLALWAIVSLRWPVLEEYLEEHPEVIDAISEGRVRDGDAPVIPEEALQKLIESEQVKNVFKGGNVGTSLDSKTVRKIIGISDVRATVAAVA